MKHARILFVTFVFVLSAHVSIAPAQTALTTVRVASGVDRPLVATAPPGDTTRLFILGEGGVITILNLETGTLNPVPFLDISDRVDDTEARDQGTGGMAFDPDYENNGYFYVSYFRDIGGAFSCPVSRFSRITDDTADPDSEQILMVVPEPSVYHDVSWLEFGPNDGYLYIGVGDGGLIAGASDNAQDITDIHGKVLRIDPHGTNGPGGLYGIPPTNPFVGVTGADEVWIYGLRSPWRGSFDRVTGDLYVGDVGEVTWEEINFLPNGGVGGENLGWDCREGQHNYQFNGDCSSQTFVEPIHEYQHVSGQCAMIGGTVYRGCAIPDLQGAYLFADFCTFKMWSLRYDVQSQQVTEMIERTAELSPGGGLNIRWITTFGTDALGEIYICCRGASGNVVDTFGEIFKIVPINVQFEETYDADPGPFAYQDDTFRGTSNPSFADGTYEAVGGLSGGGVHVILGGNSTEMSGGWATNVDITTATTVQLKVSYRLLFTGAYESDEIGQALMSVDGTLVGDAANNSLHQFAGNGSSNFDSGWVTKTFSVAFTPGPHEIIVGGYNNKSTTASEITEVFFDDVRIATLDEDTDGDNIHDNCDNCPDQSNIDQADADEDGAGDACDGCPNDPNKLDPGVCGCGVPETAPDGDMNLDLVVDGLDIHRFVDALVIGPPLPSDNCHGDFDGINQLDIGDLPGFVSALLNAP